MTNNQEPGCFYYAALGAFGTAVFLLGATVGYGIKGYQGTEEKTPSYQASIESQQDAICDLAIAPLRRDFVKKCNRENFERGTLLQKIAEQRDLILEQYECDAQKWECKAVKPYDLDNSEFVVEFSYK